VIFAKQRTRFCNRDDGQREPIEALFIDQLHLNEAGYQLWTSIIRPILMRDLGY